MGSSVSRPVVTTSYSYKCVTYCITKNNIVVVYGKGRKHADCIITEPVPGARVDLMGPNDTICIIKHRAKIHCSGIIRMEHMAALLRLEEGASIDVGTNGRLIIDGTLILEKNTRLVVEPGACLIVRGALCVSNGATLTVRDCSYDLWKHIIVPVSLTVDTNRYDAGYDRKQPITWSEKDKRFLVQLMLFFCNDHRLPTDLIYPLLLPTVCQRYGVLMSPRPYQMGDRCVVKWVQKRK
jgi:hypothetical protein